MGAIGFMAVVASLVVPEARAGVYDNVTAWWQFDKAASGTISTATDIRDARAWYNTGNYKATAIEGTPEWTATVPARGPGGGQTFGGRGMLFSPATDGTNVSPDGFLVNNLALAGDVALVTRFKWDGYAADVNDAWIYGNGFDFATDKGWLLGLSGTNGNPFLLHGQNYAFSVPWTTTAGKWYDLAIVLDDNGAGGAIKVYRWEEGGNIQSWTPSSPSAYTGLVNTTSGTRVGFEDNGGNARKAFKGTIENLAVWNRTLSTAEVHEAFGWPNPSWTLGIDNNGNLDFNTEGAVDADYTIGQPWGEAPCAVTQYGGADDRKFNINFQVTAQQAALNQVFHLDTAGARSPNFPLTVSLNGRTLDSRLVTGNRDYEWLLPAGSLQAGSNRLTLEYTGPTISWADGGNYVIWDWMELGGAWQVGYDDNSQAEFSAEGAAPNDYYVTDPVWKHLERALTHGQPDTRLHFSLSPELARYDFDYTFEFTGQSIASGIPIDVLINDQLLANIPASNNGTVVNLVIPSSMLLVGDNAIRLVWAGGDSGYTQFDYHRLQVHIPEPASIVLAALGLVGIVVRRRRRS
jgi:hypothetical protein